MPQSTTSIPSPGLQTDPRVTTPSSQLPRVEADPDSIKLFVGQVLVFLRSFLSLDETVCCQIPREMDEEHLRPMLEKCGEIVDFVILRDRQSGRHKGAAFPPCVFCILRLTTGCAFLTYKTKEAAEQAIENFHCKVTLPSVGHFLLLNHN